ncbi:MAG: small, acid-soluble spore protein, alpha/beta type [Lachnospiraceae bacterium]|nr:small, acid-soluble spore protein, alpha/beta type [Lachnospiraceae bacterium]
MGKKKDKPIDLNNLTQEEKLKLEIAEEIGVYDKVIREGWRSLSAKESGRIGGMMTRKKRELLAGNAEQE